MWWDLRVEHQIRSDKQIPVGLHGGRREFVYLTLFDVQPVNPTTSVPPRAVLLR
jgi:hypothetical protein